MYVKEVKIMYTFFPNMKKESGLKECITRWYVFFIDCMMDCVLSSDEMLS